VRKGKKISPQVRLGQEGVNLIERIVLQELRCTWTPTHSASDVGIDGYIDICDPRTGESLNFIVQVQSKATLGRWESETDDSFAYRVNSRDLRHWIGGNAPMILVLSRPSTNEAYWVAVRAYFSDPGRRGYTIVFNKKSDRFDHQALASLQQIAKPRGMGLYLGPPPIAEQLWSNLLPVSRYYPVIHSAETSHRKREEIRSALSKAGHKNAFAWILKDGKIYSFFDLSTDPWFAFCKEGTVYSFPSDDWALSKDLARKADFVQLLTAALRGYLGSKAIWYHQPENGAGYFYFAPTKDLGERDVSWKTVKASKRSVFTPYPSKKEPGRIAYYRHLGFETRFHRFDNQWYLEITPTYHFTKDGKEEHPYAGELRGNIKRIEKHAAIAAHLRFLSYVLTARERDLLTEDNPLELVTLVEPRSFSVDFGIPENDWLKKADEEEKELLAESEDLQRLLFDEG
jgi:uncharacterized protein DUF4365